MEIKKVGVLGCGLMGSGIAQVAATAGFDVTVLEQEQKFLDKGFAGIEKSLAKFAEKPEKTGITPEMPFYWRSSIHDGIYNFAGILIRPGNLSTARFVGCQPGHGA